MTYEILSYTIGELRRMQREPGYQGEPYCFATVQAYDPETLRALTDVGGRFEGLSYRVRGESRISAPQGGTA